MKLPEGQPRGHTLAHVPLEAGGVGGRQPDVLVHVKGRHPRPVEIAAGHQLLEERELRVAGGEHHVRGPACVEGLTNRVRAVGRGRTRHRLHIVEDTNRQVVGGERPAHWNCGSQRAVAASISSVIRAT